MLKKLTSLKKATACTLSLAMLTLGTPAFAGLGENLTPIGAEKAGNREGTIPAWTGGLTQMPAGWSQGDPRPNPFADDARLFTIDAGNADQYSKQLTPGQLALINAYDGYRMDVYPSRRTCAYPQRIYDRTAANVDEAAMSADGALTAGYGGVLFPVPENGWEVMMNHRTAFRGVGNRQMITTVVKQSDGGNKIYRGETQSFVPMYAPGTQSFDDTNGYMSKFVYTAEFPVKSAGTMGLVHEFFNQTRESWAYLPGLRRVRKAPTIAYDNPAAGQDGLRTFDQTGMFNGDGDRYNWDLMGKQELYIGYNAWKFRDPALSIEDIVGEKYASRDLARYELHRVWKVQAMLKPSVRNIFTRRDFYIDEDSWNIVQADLYDARGELWRVQEAHMLVAAELPACVGAAGFYYDLEAQLYVADNLVIGNDESNYSLGVEIDGAHFTPAYLRRSGRR